MFSICNHATFHVTGDEILAINGKSLQGMSHDEAISNISFVVPQKLCGLFHAYLGVSTDAQIIDLKLMIDMTR